MIGLDTNVIVRYIVRDDPEQTARATHVIERGLTIESPGFISIIAMAEIAWVLESVYGLSAKRIASTIEALLHVDTVAVEHEQEVFAAMVAFRDGRGSFGDALIGELGARAGCTHTLTFDRKASQLAHFKPL